MFSKIHLCRSAVTFGCHFGYLGKRLGVNFWIFRVMEGHRNFNRISSLSNGSRFDWSMVYLETAPVPAMDVGRRGEGKTIGVQFESLVDIL